MQGTAGSTTFSTIIFREGRLQAKNEFVLLEQGSAIASFRQRVDLDGWWLPLRMYDRGDGRRACSGKSRRELSFKAIAEGLFCSCSMRHDERVSACRECDCRNF